MWFTATCFVDDSGQSQGPNGNGDGIQVVVNGKASPELVYTGYGAIDPEQPFTCTSPGATPLNTSLFPDGIGEVVTVGNKPACLGTLDADDRFVGHIDYAEVFKQ